MATSMHERSAALIDLVERSGMREQLEARVEAQEFERRKALVAERKRLLAECERVTPALDAAYVEAREARELLEKKLVAARQIENYAAQRAQGTRMQYGTAQIDADIERHAPRFLQNGYDALQEAIDFLRGTIRVWSTQQRVGWNFHTVDVSDCEEVAALRKQCEAGQEQIKAMMYDDRLSIDDMRARCASIVDECVALTQPRLQDDKHWQLHQERKARAQRKSA